MPPFGISSFSNPQFFNIIPPWITDPKDQKPGTVEIAPRLGFKDSLSGVLNGSFIWDTENLLWLVMSLCVSIFFPYPSKKSTISSVDDDSSSQIFNFDFFLQRFLLWSTIMIVYVGFFYVALYELNWSSRPFSISATTKAPRSVKTRKLLHDIAFSLGGVAIWCFYESLACHLWRSNNNDINSTSSSSLWETILDGNILNIIKLIIGFPLGLIIKDFHFYFVHRMIHFGPFYNYFHALHHRNAHPEPFAGAAMHPVEHLLYQSAALVPVVIFSSSSSSLFYYHNACFTWIGLHLLISPALAHSSFEDHWQMGEAYHYYHHRFFDVNFAGGGVTFLDEWFGSGYFGPKRIDEKSSRSSSSSSSSSLTRRLEEIDAKRFGEILERAPLDEKATINPFSSPSLTRDGMISPFMFLTILCWMPWILKKRGSGISVFEKYDHEETTTALLSSCGPLLCAVLLDTFNFLFSMKHNNNSDVNSLLMYLTRPFGASRPVWETVLHLVVGLSISVVPLFVMLKVGD